MPVDADSTRRRRAAGPAAAPAGPARHRRRRARRRRPRPSRWPRRSTTTGRTAPTSSAPGRSATAARWTTAVEAGALDEVSADWLQSRADGSVVAPRLDTDFIAAARRQGLPRLRHAHRLRRGAAHLRPRDLGGDPQDGGVATPARRGRRRLVPRLRRRRRRRRLGGGQGLAPGRVLGVRGGARRPPARRRPPDRRRRLSQAERARRLGRPAGAGLGAARPRRRPVPRHDLQLLGLVVRPGPALAAGLDGPRAQLRRDAGRAAPHRHGPRVLRARLARVGDHRPRLGRRRARSARSSTRARRAPRRASSTSPTAATAPATRPSSPTRRPCAPRCACCSRDTRTSAACTPG